MKYRDSDTRLVLRWGDAEIADGYIWTWQGRVEFFAEVSGGLVRVMNGALGPACAALVPSPRDPNLQDIFDCSALGATATPTPIGFLKRGARLVREVAARRPGFDAPASMLAGFDATGNAAVFNVDDDLWLWKSATGEVYGLGTSVFRTPCTQLAQSVTFDPIGRRVLFLRRSAGCRETLIAFDPEGPSEQLLADPGIAVADISALAAFSPDGRRAVYFANVGEKTVDMVAKDFDGGGTVTLASNVYTTYLTSGVRFTASGDRVVYAAEDQAGHTAHMALIRTYDFGTGAMVRHGEAREIVVAPGGGFAAFRTSGGDVVLLDDATGATRVLASTKNADDVTGIYDGGLQPTPDGKRLAFVDGHRDLRLHDVAKNETITLAHGAGGLAERYTVLPPYTDVEYRAVSAFFASDGRSLVYARGFPQTYASISAFTDIVRLDLGAGTETALGPAPVSQRQLHVVSPSGQIVFATPSGMMLGTWQGTPEMLSSGVDTAGARLPAFAADDRYLLFLSQSDFLVRDAQAGGAQRRLATNVSTNGSVFWVSPATGVALIRKSAGVNAYAFTAYAPGGATASLVPVTYATAGAGLVSPSRVAAAFGASDVAGQGVFLFRFREGAGGGLAAEEIGNGEVLGVSDRQVMFRDLDGICSLAL